MVPYCIFTKSFITILKYLCRFFFTHDNPEGLGPAIAEMVMKRRLSDVICDNFPQTKVTLIKYK
jgi:hypothetical protein